MGGILKEEIFTTIKKKRFIILTALLLAGAAVMIVFKKNDYFNDLTCLFAMKQYINYIFNPAIGAILIFSVYRKRYTNSSITRAEEHGAKRSTAVIARAAAGSIILAVCYAAAAAILLITALILGANLSASQTGMFLSEVLSAFIAAVTIYNGALFWLFPYIFVVEDDVLDNMVFKVCSYVLPKSGMDVFAAGLIYGNPKWIHVLICIAYIVLTVFLAAVVFRFKKFKVKKKKGETEVQDEVTT